MTTTKTQFVPGELWLDNNGVHINAHGGGMLFHEGVYYWFGEHKIETGAGNFAQVGVHCYSSTDLYNWNDEGIALKVSTEPGHDIEKGCVLERPKVIYNPLTKKFVMWFHLELLSDCHYYASSRSGVAVADKPTGPFTFLYSARPDAGYWPQGTTESDKKPLTEAEQTEITDAKLGGCFNPKFPKDLVWRRDVQGGQMARDMTLFVDDDGHAYHIYSSEENGTLHISQLSPDFQKSNDKYARFFPARWHEAPSIMKRKGVYYMITSDCTGWAPNAARLCTAPSIWGPWTELENPCVGTPEQLANTFESQSTYLLKVQGLDEAYIYLGDRWRPDNAIDGRYIWLPIQYKNDVPFIAWLDRWDLGFFKK